MKEFFLQLLSESGNVSMTRFISLGCLVISGFVAVTGIIKGTDLNSVAMLVTAFLVPSVTGKIVQSSIERK